MVLRATDRYTDFLGQEISVHSLAEIHLSNPTVGVGGCGGQEGAAVTCSPHRRLSHPMFANVWSACKT